MSEKVQDNRSLCWATLVYQESAAENWLQLIEDGKVPVFVSPCHDKDIEGTGESEVKKAHYHVLAMFSSKKSHEQVKEFFASFGGVGVERVKDRRAYARYLCHLDSPNKAQYDTSDVVSFYADYLEVIGLPSDKYEVLDEILKFIEDYDVVSYASLVQFARKYQPRWFRVMCDSSTLFLTEYLKSRKWTKETQANGEFDRLEFEALGVVE